jgi:hypothetical protein
LIRGQRMPSPHSTQNPPSAKWPCDSSFSGHGRRFAVELSKNKRGGCCSVLVGFSGVVPAQRGDPVQGAVLIQGDVVVAVFEVVVMGAVALQL